MKPLTGDEADYQVAYYTGAQRIPLCGHDTIAATALLAQTGRMADAGHASASPPMSAS